jgi:hypothetical protein
MPDPQLVIVNLLKAACVDFDLRPAHTPNVHPFGGFRMHWQQRCKNAAKRGNERSVGADR